ncbi:Uncharacterised protein [Salmonella enterica subsp. enterica serovar Typhi]|nr:Uncharacterised protein [Salmonella enterica subsp. enterica serovar Typhi]CGY14774.1 Uncharacterised protein [Salmonella enterica subsp. enterica serovar Typhi]
MQHLRLNDVRGKSAFIAHFTDANIKIGLAFTLQYRQRRVRLGKVLLAAVFFFYGDIKIAAAAGGVQVGDLESALRHG